MEIWVQILLTIISAIIPAVISYFVARYQGKTDLKKANEANKNEIEKLIKQHEINLEALKEQHKLSMEAIEKEQEYKLQLLQKEYELKIKTNFDSKKDSVLAGALNGLMGDFLSNPQNVMNKVKDIQKYTEELNGLNAKTNKDRE